MAEQQRAFAEKMNPTAQFGNQTVTLTLCAAAHNSNKYSSPTFVKSRLFHQLRLSAAQPGLMFLRLTLAQPASTLEHGVCGQQAYFCHPAIASITLREVPAPSLLHLLPCHQVVQNSLLQVLLENASQHIRTTEKEIKLF